MQDIHCRYKKSWMRAELYGSSLSILLWKLTPIWSRFLCCQRWRKAPMKCVLNTVKPAAIADIFIRYVSSSDTCILLPRAQPDYFFAYELVGNRATCPLWCSWRSSSSTTSAVFVTLHVQPLQWVKMKLSCPDCGCYQCNHGWRNHAFLKVHDWRAHRVRMKPMFAMNAADETLVNIGLTMDGNLACGQHSQCGVMRR